MKPEGLVLKTRFPLTLNGCFASTLRLQATLKAAGQHAFHHITGQEDKTHLRGQTLCQLHRISLGRNQFELDSESSLEMGLPLRLADSQTCPPLSPGHRLWHSSDIITGSFHPEFLWKKKNKTKGDKTHR